MHTLHPIKKIILRNIPQIRFLTKLFVGFSIVSLVLISCNKEDTELGSEILPKSDFLHAYYSENTQVSSYTDTAGVVTSSDVVTALIGSYQDPIFGKSSSDFVTSVRLSSNGKIFVDSNLRSVLNSQGKDILIDSITLSFAFVDFYSGYSSIDSSAINVSFDIYETEETPSSDLTSDYIPLYNPAPLAQVSFNKSSLIETGSDSYLSVRLPDSLGQRIINHKKNETDWLQYISSNSDLQSIFKGLYFKTETSVSNAISYFYIDHERTKLTLYYTDTIQRQYDLLINTECARANLFTQSGKTFQTGSDISDSLLYLQSMGGSRIKFGIDGMESWKDSGLVAFNKAELVFKVANGMGDDSYYPPSELYLFRVTETGGYGYVEDYIDNLGTAFGGTYDATNNEYRFNIPRHLQKILKGDVENYGFILYPKNDEITANRVVLKGASANEDGMKLEITYVKL